MNFNNTITLHGNRTGVSSTGNIELFDFEITSDKKLQDDTVKQIVNSHGCGGQECSWEYSMNPDGQHIYNGKSTRYSD